jgi:hypothetical protein
MSPQMQQQLQQQMAQMAPQMAPQMETMPSYQQLSKPQFTQSPY